MHRTHRPATRSAATTAALACAFSIAPAIAQSIDDFTATNQSTANAAHCPPTGSENVHAVRAQGLAPTRERAIQRALRQAVEQINGMHIDADTRFASEFSHVFDDDAQTINIDTRADEDIRTQSSGLVARYSILDESIAPDGEHAVTLCAHVPAYTDDWRPGKPTIAVVPLDAPTVTSDRANPPTPRAIVQTFSAHANRLLIERNAFRVIDRATLDKADQELALIARRVEQGRAQPEELTQIGHQLGADFLLIPTLDRINYRRTPERGGLVNETLEFSGSVRIVRTATGQLIDEQPANRVIRGAELDRIARQEGNLATGDPLLLAARIAARDIAVPRALNVFCNSEWAGENTPITIAALFEQENLAILTGNNACSPVSVGDTLDAHAASNGVTFRVAQLQVTYINPTDGSIEATILDNESLRRRAHQLTTGLTCTPAR